MKDQPTSAPSAPSAPSNPSNPLDCSAVVYSVNRPVYDEEKLESQLHKKDKSLVTFRQRITQQCQCSVQRARAALFSLLPVLSWLPSYPFKEYIFSDVVSGLSTGVVQLPQGLAYALLAAVPPVYGLYSSFYPVLLYTFFGTSRHVSVGTFAVISLMIGGVVVREAPDSKFYVQVNGSNMSAVLDTEARDAQRVQVAMVFTTITGIIQIVLGLLRFGFVAIYLSEPLVRGFTTAAAVHVVVSQLKYLLGVKTHRYSGALSVVYSLKAVFSQISETNIPTLLLGLSCLVFLYIVKDLNERFKKRLPIPIPGEIIVVIVSTGVTYGMSLSQLHQVDIVGHIPTGLRAPTLPDFSLASNLITDAFAVAIVGYSMGISLAKIFALKHGYTVDGNQEMLAYGLCNFISSFFQTFVVTCSMSRSLVQESTGGKTQIAGLLASMVVLLVVVAIGFVFEPLPQTALAAIIIVNLLGMFKQFRDIHHLWRTSKIELTIWVIAFVSSVLLGLDLGLLVSITFGIFTVIYRTQNPHTSLLGHVPDTALYVSVDQYEEASEEQGVKIFQFNSSIYFANSDRYVSSLKEQTGVRPEHIQSLRKAQKKKTRKSQENHTLVVCANAVRGVSHKLLPNPHSPNKEEERPELEQVNGQVKGELTGADTDSEKAVFIQTYSSSIHSIVLDWNCVGFIDSVGAKAIKQVIKEYAAVDISVVIARCNGGVLDELERLQFFTEMKKSIFFPTIHDAILHCQDLNSSPSTGPETCV
ncbi:prestin [Periophthalmus magnuspinnatus]|uniref:prestin n=1 Tax=Periophthalmus magnuspinnatus TaxID=409849 RepID=UPI00145AE5EE|nr:prestin [Periophthalmus magnuspinnatus]XP_055081730.1 prestin [Periophthalmus magnuspinnatus]